MMKKLKNYFFKFLKKSWKTISPMLFGKDGLPITTIIIILVISIVGFRMKSLEMVYDGVKKDRMIDKLTMENKELRATKAQLMSTDNLRYIANKYDLKEPDEKQIIIIP
jgi:cell division protein FtsL